MLQKSDPRKSYECLVVFRSDFTHSYHAQNVALQVPFILTDFSEAVNAIFSRSGRVNIWQTNSVTFCPVKLKGVPQVFSFDKLLMSVRL